MKPCALAAIVLAALLVIAPPGVGASSATLEDPGSGAPVLVEPGAAALHLVFFATWCPTCIRELPRLAELEARWGGYGYRLVVVAVRTRQTSDRLAEFVAEAHPPGRLLFDVSGEAERVWAAKHLPTHLLLDASGREVARANTLDDQVESAIAGLLAGRRGGARGR